MLSENGFMVTFGKRANDDFWKSVISVQTNVKAQIGCGTPIIVNFFAPVNKDSLADEIKYDFRSLGDDEDLLIRNDERKYCLKQCYKMCYYVTQLYQCEIIRMRCEFVKDHNRTIWFTHASKIWARPNMQAAKASEEQERRIKRINEENRQKYMEMMQRQAEVREAEGSTLCQNLGKMMDAHYLKLKTDAGLDDASQSSGELDEETEAAFRKLRPRANHKLMDLL